jgi:hypothetical protein
MSSPKKCKLAVVLIGDVDVPLAQERLVQRGLDLPGLLIEPLHGLLGQAEEEHG